MALRVARRPAAAETLQLHHTSDLRSATEATSHTITGDHDDDDDDDDENALSNAHQPLAGVVLCCTAIPSETRSALADAARPLGATHALDLTAAVTHLLVGHWDTAKYAFVARSRPDMRVLRPEFIDAVREQWMAGADHVDVAALEREYAYPALRGARVCVTGFGDAEERKSIENSVKAAGGEYSGDLTREVTHLIAARPEGQKYAAARQWKVHVVVLRWLEDTLERNMLLEAARYDPSLAPADIGRGAWVRPSTTTENGAGSLKHKLDDGATAAAAAAGHAQGPVRKLRRTASARFSSQNQDIWGDIVGGGGGASGALDKEERRDAWAEAKKQDNPVLSDRQNVQDLRRTVSDGSLGTKGTSALGSVAGQQQGRGLFQGSIVYMHGFNERQTSVLETHLRTQAADCVSDTALFTSTYQSRISTTHDSPLPFLILTPHNHDPCILPPSVAALDPLPPLATEFYVEACLHSNRCLSPSSSPLYAPLPASVPGFAGLTLCATNFADIELLHLAKAIKLAGATYSGTLQKSVDVLLCRGFEESTSVSRDSVATAATSAAEFESRDKVRFARSNGIPLVRAGWLWACLERRGRISWTEYEIGKNGTRGMTRATTSTSGAEVQQRVEPESFKQTNTRRKDGLHGDPDPDASAAKKQALPSAASDLAHNACTRKHADNDSNAADPRPNDDDDNNHHNATGGSVGPAGDTSKESALTAALNTLLAARSRSSSFRRGNSTHSAQPASAGDSANTSFSHAGENNNTTTNGRRRRRTLLGRAPSTASVRSVLSVDSVGSANTDGVGTPVSVDTPVLAAANREVEDREQDVGKGHEEYNDNDQAMPQTQVQYQDVPAQEWRKQIEERMGITSGTGAAGHSTTTSKLRDGHDDDRHVDKPNVGQHAALGTAGAGAVGGGGLLFSSNKPKRIRDQVSRQSLDESNQIGHGNKRVLRRRA